MLHLKKRKIRPTPRSSRNFQMDDDVQMVFSPGTEEDVNYSAWSPSDTGSLGSSARSLYTTDSNKERLSCYECGAKFIMRSTSTDKTTSADLIPFLKCGMRWHCHSCLSSPPELTSIKKDMTEFKRIVNCNKVKLEKIS